MYLWVKFCDNDVCTYIRDACEDILHEIVRGNRGKIASRKAYNDVKEAIGLEGIRMAIVQAAYGNAIVRRGERMITTVKGTVCQYIESEKWILNYIDEMVKIEEVESTEPPENYFANSESVYIDLYKQKAWIV